MPASESVPTTSTTFEFPRSFMASLEVAFKDACDFVVPPPGSARQAPRMTSKERLEFYAYYKLAEKGKCSEPRPKRYQFKAFRKWSAWNDLTKDKDMSKEEAKQKYMDLVESLKHRTEIANRSHS